MAGNDGSSPRKSIPAFRRSFTYHAGKSSKNRDSSADYFGRLKKFDDSDEFRESSKPYAPEAKFRSHSKPLWSRSPEKNPLPDATSFRRPGSANPSSITSSRIFLSKIKPELPGAGDRIVLYFTTLRGIRSTYEDCRAVRTILAGFRVHVDERDISMDSSYRKELQGVLQLKTLTLPYVFIRGKYVGGAEEIKQLHESGELRKLLEGFPAVESGLVCRSCGDLRFIPCTNCNGSRKIFGEEDGSLLRCPECNENGLVRCPNCCW